MQKPTTFFSHSSQDKHALAKLKELFVAKTGGSIDVFLSSDGQSIPFGRNWVHKVEQALDQAKLMLAFVTPNSLRSNWMYFETGYAYSKGVRVIPVGLGVDLSAVGAPLNLLQGFNVTSEAGLNNIIAVVNEVFAHSHAETFSTDDFRVIAASSSGTSSNGALGPHAGTIDEIVVTLGKADLVQRSPGEALEMITATLVNEQLEHNKADNVVRAQGVIFQAKEKYGPEEIRVELDPAVADTAFPMIELLTSKICPNGMTGVSVRFDFVSLVDAVEQHHKLTGRLFGTGIRLSEGRDLGFKSLRFSVGHLMTIGVHNARRGAAYLSLSSEVQTLRLDEVRELLDVLFERGVLAFADE